MLLRCFPIRQKVALALAVVIGLVLLPKAVAAHDIPAQVILHGFVKPDGDRLHVIIRIPLILLLNMGLPKWGEGYLDLGRMDDKLRKTAEVVAREFLFLEDGVQLAPEGTAATRISQPSDPSFESFETARDNILGPPLPQDARVFWNQGYFDAYLQYPIRSEDSGFSIDMRLSPGLGDRLKMVLRYITPEGTTRAFEFHAGTGVLALDPRWYQAASTFVKLGFEHILDGIDHLLFLLCLVAPFRLRHFRTLVGIITAFTVAHSITLIAAAMGFVPAGRWFPPLVEVLIALSIVYMALENVVVALRNGQNAEASLRWRWLIAGVFGLVHGFGFSFALKQDLQFAGSHFLLSLLSFNVGVELGQLLVVGIILSVLAVVLSQPAARRYGVIILSAIVAHTAWHWMTDRIESLNRVGFPSLDEDVLTHGAAIALAVVLLALGIGFGVRQVMRGSRSSRSQIAEPIMQSRADGDPKLRG